MVVTILKSVLSLVAGLGVFLTACSTMSAHLESLGSKRLKALFSKTSKSKLAGVGIGTVATAAIQSSSATTVMVIGFVNAGIMSLTQAATIIFGANIGTTITGQIVALGLTKGNALSVSVILAAFTGVGAFIRIFAQRDIWQKIGGILVGFGMIFVGLSLMSSAMSDFAKWDGLQSFLARFNNPILLVLVGAVITALVQSSSAITSLTITMVVTGLVTLNQGIYITMGSNVGTCVTALIAGMASGTNAKRAALIHLIFNISGVVLFLLFGWGISWANLSFDGLLQQLFPNAVQVQLAMFHTIFNVITVAAVLPFTHFLVRLVTKFIPERKGEEQKRKGSLFYLDENMLKTPPVAVQQTKQELLNMAVIAMRNFNLSCEILCENNEDKRREFAEQEDILNHLKKEIAAFVVRLLKCNLSEKDRMYLVSVFYGIIDLERVGDYAENIVECADQLQQANQSFTQEVVAEIQDLQNLVQSLYQSAMLAYENGDKNALQQAEEVEGMIDNTAKEMAKKHVERLNAGLCTPEAGTQYLAFSVNAERAADHLFHVAKAIRHW
jgi:phosphate:Na+ symporter